MTLMSRQLDSTLRQGLGVMKNGVFLFAISFFILEIFTFLYYE